MSTRDPEETPSMTGTGSAADRRDTLAGDRDVAADTRDDAALSRDDTARRRDDDADQRDITAEQVGDILALYADVRWCIEEHFARVTDATGPGDPGGPTGDDPRRLRTFIDEQRRLARLDHDTLTGLLDELHDQLRKAAFDRRDNQRRAARGRRAAARDREHAATDRQDAFQDRGYLARDRAQADIERNQVEPAQLTEPNEPTDHDHQPLTPHDRLERTDELIAESRERVAIARARLDGRSTNGDRDHTGGA